MEWAAISVLEHPRGTIHEVLLRGRTVRVLITFHGQERMARWQISEEAILQALFFPEEVGRGHRDRFIAHRREGRHVVRVVYEYDGPLPVVVTVYRPLAERYFKGGGTYEDRICP
jgi:hypothetical protein